MNSEKLFDEFEEHIDNKYGHMAESMIMLAEEFPMFFEDKRIEINELSKKHLKELFEDYLDYEGLIEAECSMVFQLLIEFCSFCQGKGIEYEFFKNYLSKNKDKLFDEWQYNEEEQDNPFNNMQPKEFLENFDDMYPMFKFALKGKKPDNRKVIDFLEKTHKLMKATFEESQKIRKENPNLSEEEYLSEIDEVVEKKYGSELFNHKFSPDEIMQIVAGLPKEQAKKFFQLAFKLEDITGYKFGTIKRKDAIEDILKDLDGLISEIKGTK